jgi:hypothetical protein
MFTLRNCTVQLAVQIVSCKHLGSVVRIDANGNHGDYFLFAPVGSDGPAAGHDDVEASAASNQVTMTGHERPDRRHILGKPQINWAAH